VKITGHRFQPGVGGHLVIYCQASAEPGTGPVPGFTPSNCGWLEQDHALKTLPPEEQAAADRAEADQLILKIGGWAS
jgi:hypothetical protein